MLSCRCSADPKVVKSGFYFSMATPSRPVEPSYILQARCTIFVVARAEYSENSLINTILWSIKLDALSVLCVCEQFIFDARLKWLAGCIWVVRWNRRTEAGTWRFGRMISVRLACEVTVDFFRVQFISYRSGCFVGILLFLSCAKWNSPAKEKKNYEN